MRWERIAITAIGLAIMAAVAWQVTTTLQARAHHAATPNPAAHQRDAADQATMTPTPAIATQPAHAHGTPPTHGATTTPPRRAAIAPASANSHAHGAAATHGASASHGTSHASSPRTPSALRSATRPNTTAASRVAGGGVSGAGQLPRTGAPVWLAGVLGALLVLAGLSTHLHAVRISATSQLFRRGPALRPVSTSRIALARLVALVEAPAAASDFTTTRVRRGPRG